ncbi:MAG: Hsp20/alpha crystallin family protein [Elusimicrobiota bacterium]
MNSHKNSPHKPADGAWEPVNQILEGVEQAVAGGWYPARRLLMTRLAGAAGPELPVWVPEADIEEGDKEISVSFALPGVAKDDIRLEATDEAVTVSGRRREDAEAAEPGRREIPRGAFLRRVRLPAEVKPESAKAAYRDGVLRVTAARVRVQAGRSVKIE